jgi:transposase-like protein
LSITPQKDIDFKRIKGFETDVIKSKKCKFCGSERVVKNGKKNDKQTYKCKDCGHRFYLNNTFSNMRTDGRIIAKALDLYFDGLSVRKVRRQLKKMFGLDISFQSVYYWIKKYSKQVKNFTTSLTPDFGIRPRWHVDETVIKCKGEQNWYYDAIDSKSRFLIDTYIDNKRTIEGTTKFFKRILNTAQQKPGVIITDSMPAYHKAFNKVFYDKHKHCQHYKYKDFKDIMSNNRIERFHGTLKDRT